MANVRLKRRQDSRISNTMTLLKNRSSTYGPANQAFRGIKKIVYFRLRELIYRARQIGEMQHLNGLDAQGDFIDDTAETVARPHRAQKIRVICFGSLGEFAGRRDPFHMGDIGTDLAKLDPIERIFAVAAGS